MSKEILVVDDSEIARRDVVLPLQEAGFNVSEADSGKSALDSVVAKEFDLVISDVHMPIMNGIEFCEAMKADDRVSKKPPVLIVSTETNQDMKSRGKASGVIGWVIKPIDTNQLVAVINKLLGN